MNFYSLFYWITVADSVRKGFNVFSNIFTCFSVLSFIILVGFTIASINTNNSEKERNIYAHWAKNIKRFFIWSSTFCFITWMGYFFIPTKKDAVLIVAGGAVGNFIMKDTSAQKIPSEVMVLLRSKIKAEISEINLESMGMNVKKDTLVGKTPEELIEIIKKERVKE